MRKYIYEFAGVILGGAGPTVNKIITGSWWDDSLPAIIISAICSLLGLIIMHYGKKALNSFDNWIAGKSLKK